MNQEVQTISMNDGRKFNIVNSDVPVTNDLIRSVIGVLEARFADTPLQTLAWGSITDSNKSCIVALPCANYDAKGYITLTCPSGGIAAGGSFTISVTATNSNTVSAVYIIGIVTDPSLTPTSYPSGGSATQSPIFKLDGGKTSTSYSWVYKMPTPAVNISVASDLSSDSTQNCTQDIMFQTLAWGPITGSNKGCIVKAVNGTSPPSSNVLGIMFLTAVFAGIIIYNRKK